MNKLEIFSKHRLCSKPALAPSIAQKLPQKCFPVGTGQFAESLYCQGQEQKQKQVIVLWKGDASGPVVFVRIKPSNKRKHLKQSGTQ
jgi:hypothetical protein